MVMIHLPAYIPFLDFVDEKHDSNKCDWICKNLAIIYTQDTHKIIMCISLRLSR